MTYPAHTVKNNDEFRAGMAFAAHLLRHAVNHAHGEASFEGVARAESRRCCQGAIVAFALGMAEGLEDNALRSVEQHEHEG